jgi:undecaprenyl-diphosphatase
MIQRLLARDARLSERLRLNSTRSAVWFTAVFLAHSGDSWLWMAALAFIWLASRGDWRRTAALMAVAVLLQALVIFAVKQAIRRERPRGDWGGIYRSIDPHSFPSGHATRAVLLAVIGLGLGPAWFGLFLVFWAPLVSLARVATGVHFVSDVVVGALIGLLMGLLVLAVQNPIMSLLPFLF